MFRKLIFSSCSILSLTNLAHADGGKTFTVQNGAFPWYDRVGKWVLDEVPTDLIGKGDVEQQNCASRNLVVPVRMTVIKLAVAENDVEKFHNLYPSANQTTESLAVKSPEGTKIYYRIFDFPNPPATIGAGAKFGAGLILLTPDAKTSPAADENKVGPDVAKSNGAVTVTGAAPALDPKTAALPPMAGAALPAIDLPANANFQIYLLMGQSNMVGRDTTGLAKQVDNPRILALNPDGKWVIAREPMHDGGTGIGPGISFAAEMLRTNPTVTIGLVPCAVGGTPLKRWVQGADLYTRAINRAKVAAGAGTIKGMLWHQGESNSDHEEDAATYQAKLTQMFIDLRHDLALPDLPIVVGQLGEFLPMQQHPFVNVVRKAIAQVVKDTPHAALADSVGLGHKGDQLHFSASAQMEFGKRYAAAMVTLQNQPVAK